MPEPLIRRAVPGDCTALAELSGELGYPVDADGMRSRILALAGMSSECVLVAEDPSDGRVVGWLHAGVRRTLETGPRCEILGLVVTELARGTGAGSALLRGAEQWGAAAGAPEMLVRSQSKRTEAHNFYRRRGYRDLKIQNVFLKTLKPNPE